VVLLCQHRVEPANNHAERGLPLALPVHMPDADDASQATGFSVLLGADLASNFMGAARL
jgi:hypothetical protein